MRVRSLSVVVAGASASMVVWACNATGPGPTPPITSAILDAGPDAPQPDTGVVDAGNFFACATDTDCVPVKKNSCCDNGFKEAVNKDSVEAYRASFTCSTKQICPLFRIDDTRVPRCGRETHACELVRPDGGPGLPTPR